MAPSSSAHTLKIRELLATSQASVEASISSQETESNSSCLVGEGSILGHIQHLFPLNKRKKLASLTGPGTPDFENPYGGGLKGKVEAFFLTYGAEAVLNLAPDRLCQIGCPSYAPDGDEADSNGNGNRLGVFKTVLKEKTAKDYARRIASLISFGTMLAHEEETRNLCGVKLPDEVIQTLTLFEDHYDEDEESVSNALLQRLFLELGKVVYAPAKCYNSDLFCCYAIGEMYDADTGKFRCKESSNKSLSAFKYMLRIAIACEMHYGGNVDQSLVARVQFKMNMPRYPYMFLKFLQTAVNKLPSKMKPLAMVIDTHCERISYDGIPCSYDLLNDVLHCAIDEASVQLEKLLMGFEPAELDEYRSESDSSFGHSSLPFTPYFALGANADSAYGDQSLVCYVTDHEEKWRKHFFGVHTGKTKIRPSRKYLRQCRKYERLLVVIMHVLISGGARATDYQHLTFMNGDVESEKRTVSIYDENYFHCTLQNRKASLLHGKDESFSAFMPRELVDTLFGYYWKFVRPFALALKVGLNDIKDMERWKRFCFVGAKNDQWVRNAICDGLGGKETGRTFQWLRHANNFLMKTTLKAVLPTSLPIYKLFGHSIHTDAFYGVEKLAGFQAENWTNTTDVILILKTWWTKMDTQQRKENPVDKAFDFHSDSDGDDDDSDSQAASETDFSQSTASSNDGEASDSDHSSDSDTFSLIDEEQSEWDVASNITSTSNDNIVEAAAGEGDAPTPSGLMQESIPDVSVNVNDDEENHSTDLISSSFIGKSISDASANDSNCEKVGTLIESTESYTSTISCASIADEETEEATVSENAGGTSFAEPNSNCQTDDNESSDGAVSDILNKLGLSSFKSRGQEALVREVLFGKSSVLGVLPTGGGKSLAMFACIPHKERRLTVAVFPLIAVLNDVKTRLEDMAKRKVILGYQYQLWSPGNTAEEFLRSRTKLLLLSAEQAQDPRFHIFLRQAKQQVARVIFDEAPVFSSSPYRKNLALVPAILRSSTPAKFVLLSATVPVESQKKLLEVFGVPKAGVVRTCTANPNLVHSVCKLKKGIRRIDELKTRILDSNGCVILFVKSVAQCVELAGELNRFSALRSNVAFYHAQLNATERTKAHEEWKSKSKRVMVATTAFAFGVDSADCNLVIHVDGSYDLETYCQGAGRAGRNGQPALSILLLSHKPIQSYRCDDRKMLDYMRNTTTCRRVQLSQALDTEDLVSNATCGSCDICLRLLLPAQAMTNELRGKVRTELSTFDPADERRTADKRVSMSKKQFFLVKKCLGKHRNRRACLVCTVMTKKQQCHPLTKCPFFRNRCYRCGDRCRRSDCEVNKIWGKACANHVVCVGCCTPCNSLVGTLHPGESTVGVRCKFNDTIVPSCMMLWQHRRAAVKQIIQSKFNGGVLGSTTEYALWLCKVVDGITNASRLILHFTNCGKGFW